jgi:hypothetical protein
MKFSADRPTSAARELIEVANMVEAAQNGWSTCPSWPLTADRGEHGVALKRFSIEPG